MAAWLRSWFVTDTKPTEEKKEAGWVQVTPETLQAQEAWLKREAEQEQDPCYTHHETADCSQCTKPTSDKGRCMGWCVERKAQCNRLGTERIKDQLEIPLFYCYQHFEVFTRECIKRDDLLALIQRENNKRKVPQDMKDIMLPYPTIYHYGNGETAFTCMYLASGNVDYSFVVRELPPRTFMDALNALRPTVPFLTYT
jgi:hypothetical protein